MIAFALVLSFSAAPVVSGVDPAVYLSSRSGKPEAMRELKRMPVEVSLRILDASSLDEFLSEKSVHRATEERVLLEGALAAVVEHKHPRAQALVSRYLAHESDYVRAAAAQRSLDVDALGRIARDDVSERVRAAACVGLGMIRTRAALDVLAPLARDTKDVVRAHAARAAIRRFLSTWSPVSPELRADAARALAR